MKSHVGSVKPSKVSPGVLVSRQSILHPQTLNMSHHIPYASFIDEPTRTAPNAHGDTVQYFCNVFLLPVESGGPGSCETLVYTRTVRPS
eukprot:481877-Prymnesium_polylepis.1